MEKLGYSIEEAARAIGVGRTVMCSLLKSGAIKSVEIGRRRVVPADAVRLYMRDLVEAQNRELVAEQGSEAV